MGDVDFKEVSPVLGHIVASHWTRNGKWLDLCSYWKWHYRCWGFCWGLPCKPPPPPYLPPPFTASLTPSAPSWIFFGTHPPGKIGYLNLCVSLNTLPKLLHSTLALLGQEQNHAWGFPLPFIIDHGWGTSIIGLLKELEIAFIAVHTHCCAHTVWDWILNGSKCSSINFQSLCKKRAARLGLRNHHKVL